ncbi:MAG: hypothetical protein RL722_1488 [Pseudomonadota bacterium]|jgi:geranylgeranyl reductase family protein
MSTPSAVPPLPGALATATLAPIPDATPPADCDVLVVGAGPSGSACAIALSQAGWRVVLVDQHSFPRDKICGDGLIPDAHRALDRLGVLARVLAQARAVSHVACIAPRGGRVAVPGRLAVLPRRRLDHLLVQRAIEVGVQLATPWRFEGVIEGADGRVLGARLSDRRRPHVNDLPPGAGTLAPPPQAATTEVRARWVVLATGAAVAAMQAAGLCERRTPTGVALRTYIHAPDLRGGPLSEMEVVWHRRLRPGYGWIFPCGDDVYNVGVGAFHGETAGRAGPQANLRQLFEAFADCHPAAGELVRRGRILDAAGLKGAPLRCTLDGARLGRPGLLATGEAIGSTYDFTGEGIGKALETGLLAAAALGPPGVELAQDAADVDADAAVLAGYEAAIEALRPQFRLYARANQVNRHPWLADLVIWRAQRSAALRRRMAGVLNETSNPGHITSLRGLRKLLFE